MITGVKKFMCMAAATDSIKGLPIRLNIVSGVGNYAFSYRA